MTNYYAVYEHLQGLLPLLASTSAVISQPGAFSYGVYRHGVMKRQSRRVPLASRIDRPLSYSYHDQNTAAERLTSPRSFTGLAIPPLSDSTKVGRRTGQ